MQNLNLYFDSPLYDLPYLALTV